MADNRWTSRQAKTAQLNTVTPASVGVGNTFTLTINSKTATFTATDTTVATVTAGLVALWNAEDEGEMEEVTAADGTTALTLTADKAGTPFTQTSSASGGTASLTTVATTANKSPNDVNDALNWTDGVPTAADVLVLDAGGSGESLWWNLSALSAVTVTSLTRRRTFTGKVGLPEFNEDGSHSYFEYRATELAIGATTMLIEQPSSDETEHVKINNGTIQTTLTINGEGASQLGAERMWWRGTHASNVANVNNGSLAVSPTNLNTATIATLRAETSTVRCGSAVTLTTVTSIDSTLEINSSVTTFTQRGDAAVATFQGAAVLTTANVFEGTLIWKSSGAITTLTPGPGCTIDFSQATGAVTVTNAVTLPAGVTIKDPEGRVTWSGGLVLGTGVRLADVSLDLGTGRTLGSIS
jgi:hypothetical protein